MALGGPSGAGSAAAYASRHHAGTTPALPPSTATATGGWPIVG